MIDVIFIIPLLWGAYQGYKKGILSEVIGVIYFAVSFAVSFKLIGFAYKFLKDGAWFQFIEPLEAHIIFGVAVGVTMILLVKVGVKFKTEVEYDFPGQWDNIVGAFFGLIKWAFAMSFVWWFISGFAQIPQKTKDSAFLFPYIELMAAQSIGGEDSRDIAKVIKDNM